MQKRLIISVLMLLSSILPQAACVQTPSADEAAGTSQEKKAPTPQPGSSTEQAPAQTPAPAPSEAPRYSGPIQFTDVSAQAGIRFKHNSGAYGKHYMPETVGAGGAFLDYDNDGWQDVLLINSMNWPDHKGAKSLPALYHNNKNGTFTDVTKEAGLAVEVYGLGCAAADYDNDGNLDIYITCLGANHLFRNAGNGKFTDVTARAGVGDPGFSTSAAWVDYDKDGKLDLFVCNYVEWSIDKDIVCMLDGKNKSYCTPEAYKGQSSTLYHNEGDGLFIDEAPASTIGQTSMLTLTFSCFFFDYDLDGLPDIFAANGHVSDDINAVQPKIKYAQPPHLFRNLASGHFAEVTGQMGAAFAMPRVARGAAYADIDGDGDLDVLMTTNAGPALLFRNDGGNQNHALRVTLVGTKSNRDGIGSVVRIQYGAQKQWQMLRSGSSYLSQSELVLTFGLGASTSVDGIDIEWPSGQRDHLSNIVADQTVTVEESKGVIASRKFNKRATARPARSIAQAR